MIGIRSMTNLMQGTIAVPMTARPRLHTKHQRKHRRAQSVEPKARTPRHDLSRSQTFDYVTPRPSETAIPPFEREGVGEFVYGSALSTAGTKNLRILCYGDSNSIGFRGEGKTLQPYGQELAEALRVAGFPCEVTSCGLCGFTSEELVNEIREPYIQPQMGPPGAGLAHLLQDGEFDLVIIMVGTNDVGMSKDPRLTHAFVTRLHSTCHALGIKTVNIAPTTVCEKNTHKEIRRPIREARNRLADSMHSWAQGCPNVLLSLDCERIVPKNIQQLWERDEIHLSRTGSKQLAQRLASQLARVLGQLGQGKAQPAASPPCPPRKLQPVMQACSVPVLQPSIAFQSPRNNLNWPTMGTYAIPGVMTPLSIPRAVCIY